MPDALPGFGRENRVELPLRMGPGTEVRVLRNDVVAYDGKMGSLKRFAEDAREVLEGFECGILVDGFNDLKEGDVLEAYETREVAREA